MQKSGTISAHTRQLEYLNPAYEEIFGESRDPIMHDVSRWSELIHPEDRDCGADMLDRLLTGESVTVTYRIVRPNDGAIRWIRDTGFPIRDEHGVIRRVAGVLQDMTNDQKKTAALAESEERFRLLIDGAPDYAIPAQSDRTHHLLEQRSGAGLRLDPKGSARPERRAGLYPGRSKARTGAERNPHRTPQRGGSRSPLAPAQGRVAYLGRWGDAPAR